MKIDVHENHNCRRFNDSLLLHHLGGGVGALVRGARGAVFLGDVGAGSDGDGDSSGDGRGDKRIGIGDFGG